MDFLKSVLTFRGRSGRLNWLLVTLFAIVASSAPLMAMPELVYAMDGGDFGMMAMFWAWVAVVSVPWAAAASRRSHDIGITGWAAAALVVPFISILAMVLWAVLPGTRGDNKYGPAAARPVAA